MLWKEFRAAVDKKMCSCIVHTHLQEAARNTWQGMEGGRCWGEVYHGWEGFSVSNRNPAWIHLDKKRNVLPCVTKLLWRTRGWNAASPESQSLCELAAFSCIHLPSSKWSDPSLPALLGSQLPSLLHKRKEDSHCPLLLSPCQDGRRPRSRPPVSRACVYVFVSACVCVCMWVPSLAAFSRATYVFVGDRQLPRESAVLFPGTGRPAQQLCSLHAFLRWACLWLRASSVSSWLLFYIRSYVFPTRWFGRGFFLLFFSVIYICIISQCSLSLGLCVRLIWMFYTRSWIAFCLVLEWTHSFCTETDRWQPRPFSGRSFFPGKGKDSIHALSSFDT